ncbi:MAG: ABC transporter permease [Flavobacteriaceae bacterium]|nr:ABC transporter permease [Flavobacteriaceae bacterium]
MSFSFIIAKRYFFSKSTKTVVNRINIFSLIVLIICSTSLLIVLSAFDGLKDFGLSFYKKFDPDFQILPSSGKTLFINSDNWEQFISHPMIDSATRVIEEKVFVSLKEKNQAALIRGVYPDYTSVNSVDNLIAIGDWIDFDANSVVLGYELASSLNAGVYDYSSYLELSVPKNTPIRFGDSPFVSKPAFVSGLYQISEDIDKKYLFSSISFAKSLLNFSNDSYSYIAINTNENFSEPAFLNYLKSIFDDDVILQSREQKNSAIYKMIKIENLAIYLIFTLVVIIGMFNIIGALIMMKVDKSSQINLFYSLGASPKSIERIFFLVGLFISFSGAIIGTILGVCLVLVQDYNPFIFVPGTDLAYPVSLLFKNICIVISTVLFLGAITSAWATRGIAKSIP